MSRSIIALTLVLGLTLTLAAPQPVSGQNQEPLTPVRPSDDDVVRITTNLVQVDTVVTDNKGKPVTDLRAEELQILEDGKPQQITNFSFVSLGTPAIPSAKTVAEKNAPPAPPVSLKREQIRRTIAVVVDDLGLSFESVYYAREALKEFVDQQVQPEDLVAIIRTRGGIGALQQFTSDKRQLLAAIDRIKWVPSGRGGVSAFAPLSGGEEEQDGDDAVNQLREEIFSVGTLGAVRYVVSGLSELPGRKSVVLLSDGLTVFNPRDLFSTGRVLDGVRRLIELANRASVVIYTLDVRGLQTLGLTAADSVGGLSPLVIQRALDERRAAFHDSQDGLIYLAKETGGFAVRNTNDITDGIKRVIEDQNGYYLIGYRPDPATFVAADSRRKFHRLSLKVLRQGRFTVRMRNGFLGIPDEDVERRPVTPQQKMLAALISPFGSGDIQLRLTSLFANDAKLGSLMRSYLHIESKDLTFVEAPDGWHKATFDILAVTFGDNGVPVDQISRTHTVSLKGDSYEQALRRGILYNLFVPIKKPGAYQLRTVLRDITSNRVGSANQFIEVPDINKHRLTMSGILVMATPREVLQKSNQQLPQATEADNSSQSADARGTIAYRQFRRGQVMEYGFVIYNAKTDKASGRPLLLSQVRMFKAGRIVSAGKELPFDATGQQDLRRLVAGGALQLGTEMDPGEYVLQILVTDQLVKRKHRVTSQWIDFVIVE